MFSGLFIYLFICLLFCLLFYVGMRASWRTLGMYCCRIGYLDWDTSC